MTAPDATEDRKMIQGAFIAVCRSSRFTLSPERAAQFTGLMLKRHPLEVWLAMPSWGVMEEIAAGSHPCVKQHILP